MMSKGLFVSFEGGEGSGKSTIIKLIAEKFENVVLTREPGGTKIAEQIREIILDTENTEMNLRTEALLYASSRAQHVEEVIKPALASNKLILCDRYIDSSVVYQSIARGNDIEDIKMINNFAMKGIHPDITFLFDIQPSVALKRVSKRSESDRLDLEKFDFHKKIYDGYNYLFDNKLFYAKNIYKINADRSVEEIFNEVYNKISSLKGDYE